MHSNLKNTIAFLNQIDITTIIEPVTNGFLNGVTIHHGTLAVDAKALPGDVLHEAGHLAITPVCYRSLLDGGKSGNLARSMQKIHEHVEKLEIIPDSKFYRAYISSDDQAATAWAWAAGIHIGLDPEDIIVTSERSYEGEYESIRLSLQLGAYAGIHSLAFAGFCRTGIHGKLPRFPKLAFWTQETSEADNIETTYT